MKLRARRHSRRRDDERHKLIGPGTAVVSVSLAHVAGARVTAAINGRHLDAGLVDSFRSLRRIPSHLSDPSGIWQVHDVLPGPGLYWTVVIAAIPFLAMCTVVSRGAMARVVSSVRLLWWRCERPDLAHLRVGVRSDMLAIGRHCRHTYGIPTGERLLVHVTARDRAVLARYLATRVAQWHMPVIVCTTSSDLAEHIRATVPNAGVIDLDAVPARGRWNPLTTIASYQHAREHTELLQPAQPEPKPSSPSAIQSAPIEILAALLWTAARSEAPSMRHVHRWANQAEPTKTIAPLLAALREHPDPHIAWDAAIVERDLHHASRRGVDVAAAFAAWDDPRIIDATHAQPGPPARVTVICDRRPSPGRVCAVNLIAHSLHTATGAVLITEVLYANHKAAIATGRPTRFVVTANDEPPDDATVHLRVDHARLALSVAAEPGIANKTEDTTRFGPPVRLRPVVGRSGPGRSRGAQSRPPHPDG